MRYTQLVFSPTGGVRKAARLLSATISDRFETIDLSLTLNGQKSARFSEEDVCLIAVPCFGGRVPEIALTRLAQTSGGGARTILLCAFGTGSHRESFRLFPFRKRRFCVPSAVCSSIRTRESSVPDAANAPPSVR